jgi:hypothetical protein
LTAKAELRDESAPSLRGRVKGASGRAVASVFASLSRIDRSTVKGSGNRTVAEYGDFPQ